MYGYDNMECLAGWLDSLDCSDLWKMFWTQSVDISIKPSKDQAKEDGVAIS